MAERPGKQPDRDRYVIGALLLALALTGMWGYGQRVARRNVELQAENSYRRAFQELIYNSDGLDQRLDRVLVANTRPMLSKSLEELRMHAYSAESNLNQLPLATKPLPNVKKFLGETVTTARDLSKRVDEGGPIRDDEWLRLRRLRDQATEVNKQLDDLRRLQVSGRLNWTEMDRFARANYDGDGKYPLGDGLTKIDGYLRSQRASAPGATTTQGAVPGDKTFSGTSPSGGPPVAPAGRGGTGPEAGKGATQGGWVTPPEAPNEPPPPALAGPKVDQAKAQEIATRFLGDQLLDAQIRFSSEAPAGPFAGYLFDFTTKDGRAGRIHVTRQGGKVVTMLADRKVGAGRITEQQARTLAGQYVTQRGYNNLAVESFALYDGQDVGLVRMVAKQGAVLVYPDEVRIRVAMDNGEVLGFSAQEYLRHHKARDLPAAKLTAEQARAQVSPRIKVQSVRLALIQGDEGDEGKEILAYEVRGKLDDRLYQIFVNAQTGMEERIRRLPNVE